MPLPLWVKILDAAEIWGVPPWEIAERPGGVKWLHRLGTVQSARARGLREKHG
jgi:hypothetical protein